MATPDPPDYDVPVKWEKSGDCESDPIDRSIDSITNSKFNEWYREKQWADNIREGKGFFNGPPSIPDSERHQPSLLLRCHRYAFYKRGNAPKESKQPDGLFWFGTEFEEQVTVPFLEDITPDDVYVQNSIWTSTTISKGDEELVIKGVTDPALVTEDGAPVLVTEVKTTSSIEYRDVPAEHHKAQLHSYLYALQEEHDRPIPGLVVYFTRDTMEMKAFSMEFDPEFWAEVVAWMAEQTRYERDDELPPASPRNDWECKFCDYEARCGKTSDPFQDLGVKGLLTLFDGYAEQPLQEYLESHEDARLTPTLAHKFPDMAESYSVADWACSSCEARYEWDSVEWDGDVGSPPMCPQCRANSELATLRGESAF